MYFENVGMVIIETTELILHKVLESLIIVLSENIFFMWPIIVLSQDIGQ